jgi:hypothetical protein
MVVHVQKCASVGEIIFILTEKGDTIVVPRTLHLLLVFIRHVDTDMERLIRK